MEQITGIMFTALWVIVGMVVILGILGGVYLYVLRKGRMRGN